VIPVGTAHTEGSLVVEVIEDRLVFAGGVLYGGRLLAVLPVSRTDGWIAAFEGLNAFGEARFVPGHGDVGALADFDALAGRNAHQADLERGSAVFE